MSGVQQVGGNTIRKRRGFRNRAWLKRCEFDLVVMTANYGKSRWGPHRRRKFERVRNSRMTLEEEMGRCTVVRRY